MLPTSINKAVIRLTIIFILFACASCKTETPYYVKNFLNDLSVLSGIGNDEDMMNNILELKDWEIIIDEDLKELDKKLDYLYMTKIISNYTGLNNSLTALSNKGWISNNKKPRETVDYETGHSVINKAIEYRNKPDIDAYYNAIYSENVKDETDANNPGDVYFDSEKGSYQKIVINNDGVRENVDAQIDEVFSQIEISDSYEIDFSEAEIIPYDDESEPEIYVNHNYEFLSAQNHSFHKSGFDISYSLNASGISVHVSKDKDKINYFADLDIYSVKPSFIWKSNKGDVKNCFFTVDFKTTEKIGASIGRYKNYYLQFEDLDSSSFMSLLKSMVNPHNDLVEASLPICKIKTPIPGLPTAFLNMDLLLNFYVSGKVELVLNNAHELGFETCNGNMRIISKHNNKLEGDIGGSAKAAMAVNFSLEAATFILADIEIEGGLRSKVKSTIHLYNEEGNRREQESDIDYSSLEDISKNNNDVKICGDLSLSWLFDIELNTYKTRLYSYGLNRYMDILDDRNQVFGNLSHIENGMFVKSCTRKNKPILKEHAFPLSSNKIVLNSYAEVIKVNETYDIEMVSLPDGYSLNDIRYSSMDNDVATVSGAVITGKKPGSCKIQVSTYDGKYNSYINILVSTG